MTQIVRLDTQALANLTRSFIGLDSLVENFENRFANQINTNYPPHNVIKHGDDRYEIQIAVTGFDPSEVSVQVDQNKLIIRGESLRTEDEDANYLYRGLARRDFTKVFGLTEYNEVGEASIKNGILTIEVTRIIPEALKPRTINIKAE